MVPNKGVKEPLDFDGVVTFADSLGYCETTVMSDAEADIIAFRHRVAEGCRAEVTTEDAVKGDRQTNGLIVNTQ